MDGLGFGFRVGHWTDREGMTGCTVILPPRGNVTSCDVRGSSPSSRELELLHTDRRLTETHGILLTGGSAYGLAAADGVVAWLAERDIGYRTAAAVVPIVPAAVVLDLGTGSAAARPGRAAGYAACDDARYEGIATGLVGAGTGCTVGKWAGFEHKVPGGVGIAIVEEAGERVAALAVVNSVGDVLSTDGSVLAGTTAPEPSYLPPLAHDPVTQNTVLALVAVEAKIDKREARFLASRGSDGITVSVRPAHTRYDGDVVFACAASGANDRTASVDVLGFLATRAVAEAVRAAVSIGTR